MLKRNSANNQFYITFLLFPNFCMSELTNMLECLRLANKYAPDPVFHWNFASRDGKSASSNLGIEVPCELSYVEMKNLDNVILLSDDNPFQGQDDLTYGLLRRLACQGSHIGGIGGGASILTSAKVSNLNKITSHWRHTPALQENNPNLSIETCMYVVDGKRFTSSGGLAVVDMLIAEVNEKLGSDIGESVSRELIHDRHRAGEEKQNVSLGQELGTANQKLIKAVSIMEENIETPISLDELVHMVGSCRRQLERLFIRHVGVTPLKFYVNLRLERAYSLLTQTSIAITEVAIACGFNSSSHFTRSYKKKYGITPFSSRHMNRVSYAA